LNKKFYFEITFLFILGAITSLSLPPFNLFIINFLTFTFYFLFLIKKSNKHKNKKLFFLYGWIFGFSYFIASLYWISISLSFDQSFKLLIPLSVFLIPAFLGIFYGLISSIFIILKPRKIISSFLTFCLIFGIMEFARGSILTGFPWNLIAYSFSNQLEILSINSVIGIYGFNLFCISLFTAPAILILSKSKKNVLIFSFFLIMSISFYIYGLFYEKKFYEAENNTYDFKVRVIGSNISLEKFYSEVDPAKVIQDLIKISNPVNDEKIIFVWPEGIIPDVFQDELIVYKKLFNENFNENHILILGINSKLTNNNHNDYFNTLSIYDSEINLINSYNKINLVPFGEFLPFENILKKLGLRPITNNYQSFSRGLKREIIELKFNKSSLKILPLICYEIIYSGKLFDNSNFDLIINISEDGWFGQSIGPKQHFIHSIFRAIESGKYVVRSSNNGIAAVVNPLGNIEQKVDFGISGYIDFKESRKIQPTIFSKYGNKVFGSIILLYILLIFSFNKIKNE
tara:strand:+ start:559 stop:2103 length:1545 start_codon:yes stop_codon:yes gene_type:complete